MTIKTFNIYMVPFSPILRFVHTKMVIRKFTVTRFFMVYVSQNLHLISINFYLRPFILVATYINTVVILDYKNLPAPSVVTKIQRRVFSKY